VSIRNCTKPLPGIKVHNCGYTKSNAQFPYIIMVIKESNTRILYIIIVLNFFEKHHITTQNHQVFAGSFMKPGGSLKFLKYPELAGF
jgi:hypothetical protein